MSSFWTLNGEPWFDRFDVLAAVRVARSRAAARSDRLGDLLFMQAVLRLPCAVTPTSGERMALFALEEILR